MSIEPGLVYIGTYTGGGSEGIYLCRLDAGTGALQLLGVAAAVDTPSYLALDDARLRLYAVNEVSDFGGRAGGGVSSFAIHAASGELSPINRVFSHGEAPCYLTLDPAGRHLFLVNYSGGNVVVLPIDEGGGLGEAADIIAHSGRSIHPERQTGPHPHAIVLDPSGDHAFVPDLGLDKVFQYDVDRATGRLAANRQPWLALAPGSGPRHMVFHPNGRAAYVINELNSTIAACAYDPRGGGLSIVQTVSTLPEGYNGANIAADLHLTPSGNILFGSNRGHNSIACYAVDGATGALTATDRVHTQGETPRGFAVDPTGAWVLVANQDSNTIVTFGIDEETSTIFPTGNVIHIPSPVCVKM